MAKKKPAPRSAPPQGKAPAKPATNTRVPAKQPNLTPPPPDTLRWVGILAAVLGGCLYLNTLGHQFCLDDYSAIMDNWVVKGGLKNLGLIFSKEYRFGVWSSPGSLYRPIPLVMFAAEWQFSPENPFVHHLVNVLLYALSGWVLWITWRDILHKQHPLLAAFTVILFMAHPVHTEVVANIKSRDEILSLLLGTLALRAVWQAQYSKTGQHVALAMLWYTLALFSKESAITLLAVFPLTLWYFGHASVPKILRWSALLLLPALLFLGVRHQVLSAQTGKEAFSILDNFIMGAQNSADKLASAFMICGRYLLALLWPYPLVSDLGYAQMKPVGFADWRAIVSFLVFASMGAWALWQMPRKHPASYAILFFLGTFSLFSNVFITIGTSYGERLLYLPSLGFALLLAWTLLQIPALNKHAQTAWVALGVIVAVYSVIAIARNPAWYDSYSLYSADIHTSPNCAKLHYHIGLEETKRGVDEASGQITDKAMIEKGIASYTKAMELYPQYHDAYGSRGLAYFRLQAYDKAKLDYDKALLHRPNDAKVLSNMGYIYFLRNNLDSAEVVYRRSIQFDPRFVDARRNLGAVLAMKKKFPEAIQQWEEGLKFEPNNKTLLQYIGSAYKDMGQPDKAQTYLNRASAQ
jgi:tetratricopeptide (TPR) repeat protein